MKTFLLTYLFLTSPLNAEIDREIKERIGKDLHKDEEFKKAVISYLEEMDYLYEDNLVDDKEKFKEQYLKYIKSKNCMGFLASLENLDKVIKYANMIDSIHTKKSNYKKVQSSLDDLYPLKDTFTKSPTYDGYKFCNFKVSEARIKKSVDSAGDHVILNTKMSTEEKSRIIFKDNVIVIKALKEFFKNTKAFYTDTAISNEQRMKLASAFNNDSSCALYFTPEDKFEPLIQIFSEYMSEIKSIPGYNQDAEKSINPDKKEEQNISGDYKNCSFQLDENELRKHKDRRATEKKEVDETYELAQRLIEISHPNIKKMMQMYESQFSMAFKDKEMIKKMFVKTMPDYIAQVDQSVAYAFTNVLKDESCRKEVFVKVELCLKDQRFALIKDQLNLLLATCIGDNKEELSKTCKFDKPAR